VAVAIQTSQQKRELEIWGGRCFGHTRTSRTHLAVLQVFGSTEGNPAQTLAAPSYSNSLG
jgi:hypothetical protein